MTRLLPLHEIIPFVLLMTAALLAACATAPPRPTADVAAPAAPSGLTAILHPDGSLVLEWRDNSADEDAFVVVRDCGEAPGRLGSVGRDRTRVVVEGPLPDAVCSFAVFAANAGGLSGPSNLATIGNVSASLPAREPAERPAS